MVKVFVDWAMGAESTVKRKSHVFKHPELGPGILYQWPNVLRAITELFIKMGVSGRYGRTKGITYATTRLLYWIIN